MSFDYAALAQTGLRLIKDNGRTVSYVVNAKGEYNPTLDELQGAVESSYSVQGVFTTIRQSDIDGTLIKNGDQFLLIAGAQSFIPKTNDIVYDGDIKYKVMDVITISPGAVPVLYKLQVRR